MFSGSINNGLGLGNQGLMRFDPEKGVAIPSGFVAPSDGWVVFFSSGAAGNYSAAGIDGQDVYVRDIGIISQTRSMYRIFKNQTVTLANTNSVFYPQENN